MHPGKGRAEVRLERCTQDGAGLEGTCDFRGVCGDGVRDPDEQVFGERGDEREREREDEGDKKKERERMREREGERE